jgi:tRNA 5-methylaminomethyl-2-thiouridine biosynthesis bifunctional protein
MSAPIGPIEPAHVDFSHAAAPRSLQYDDLYHARGGAFEQAHHVFLAGNGLPQRWAGRHRFVILETGFGLGNNFLATWAAWRDDAARCEHLWFLSIDKHPPSRADLRHAHVHAPEPALARALCDAWPSASPDLHVRHFADARVHLLLAFGDVTAWLPQWMAQVDAFYLDGFAPAKNPAMWEPRVLARLARLAAEGATVATWSSARIVRDALSGAGFEVERQAGFDAKRDMLVARHAPRYRAAPPPGRRFGGRGASVAIVGAGLAGASVAQALAQQGVASTVFDGAADVAQGGSGQIAGLLHSVVHADDTPHTRWFRAAALHAAATIAPWIHGGRVAGQLAGLLRLEHALDAAAMRRVLQQGGVPSDIAIALTRAAACERAGCDVSAPAWWFPQGGWVEPRALVRAWLDHAAIGVRTSTCVQGLQRLDNGRWRLRDSSGQDLDTFDHVVLANADGAARLAASAGAPSDVLSWPLSRSRGQVTLLNAQTSTAWRPQVPIAGAGYTIALPDGGLLCGATSDLDDDETEVRARDHERNLASLQTLSGKPWPINLASLGGRVGWRVHTRDRLPLIGGVPDSSAANTAPTRRRDQPRFIARQPGLWIFAALGSRGLTHAVLGGEIVASMITGAPLPLGSPLLDAVDAARFAARDHRK